VHAVAEGRQLLRNLQLSFEYLLMIRIRLVITATLIPLLGYPLLFLPVHVVWLEAIIHPTAILVFQELPATGRLEPTTTRDEARFFDRRQWIVLALVGVLVTVAIALTYDRSLGATRNVPHARAMALAVLTVFSALLTATLSRLRTPAAWSVTLLALIASAALIQVPRVATLLHLACTAPSR
jgi:Ca2+-transporting ATPase